MNDFVAARRHFERKASGPATEATDAATGGKKAHGLQVTNGRRSPSRNFCRRHKAPLFNGLSQKPSSFRAPHKFVLSVINNEFAWPPSFVVGCFSMEWSVLWVLVLFPFLFYPIVPFLFFLFPRQMDRIFFLNFVKVPFQNYTNLSAFGVDNGRNFYLEVKEEGGGATLGVWHILPRQLWGNRPDEELLSSGPIVVYLHGNSFDRTTRHRCELYRRLSAMGFHVLAADYRGYGDSTGRPTEEGVVADAKAVYAYAQRFAKSNPIFIWGHSMGTGVAIRTVAELCRDSLSPLALVLESPFNNLRDAATAHPYSVPFRHLPWFEWAMIESLINSGLRMDSDQNIKGVKCPILILHAADDTVVPVELGRKLLQVAKTANKDVEFTEFAADRLLGHNSICNAEELPQILQ